MKTGRSVSLVFAVAILSAFAVFAEGLDDNLVARYDFTSIEAGGKVSDLSGNGRTLTVGAGCSLTEGPFGKGALYFNGTDGKDIGSFATFSCPALESRTISFWLRVEGPEDLPNTPYLIRNLSGLVVTVDQRSDRADPVGWVGTGLSDTVKYTSASPKDSNLLHAGSRYAWHHLTLVWDMVSKDSDNCNVVFREYLDGVLEDESDEVTVPLARFSEATETATFGNTSASGRTYPIRGAMADIRVYDSAVSAEQAAELYLNARGTAKRLVAYYPMDEISGGDDGVRRSPNMAEGGLFTDLKLGDGLSLVAGQIGGALKWDDSTAAFAVATNLVSSGGGLGNWTFSAWVWTQGIMLPNSTPRIYQAECGNNLQHNKGVANNVTGTLGYGNAGTAATTEGLVVRGTWTHLACTMKFAATASGGYGLTMTIYRNGEPVETTGPADGTAVTSMLFAPGKYLALGNTLKNAIGGANSFGGRMDEVCVFSGALSADEVAALYTGFSPVDAGADFATAREIAWLRGVALRHTGAVAVPKAGEYGWSLVSAPAGGEAASILTPASLETEVRLPVEGVYVFRLESLDALVPQFDTVTVTRCAPVAGNQPPTVTASVPATASVPGAITVGATVSDPDAGPGEVRTDWSCVSGPGAVWFERGANGNLFATFSAAGTYVLACTADDGQDRTTDEKTIVVTAAATQLADELIGWWDFRNPSAPADNVSGKATKDLNKTTKRLEGGVVGYGVRPDCFMDAYLDTQVTLGEKASIADTANSRPIASQRRKTFSAWAWVDPADTNNCRGGVVVGINQSFAIRFDEPSNPGAFSIYQEGDKPSSDDPYVYTGIANATQNFSLPEGYNPTGRWTHVVAVVDRWGLDDQELWINGEKMTKSAGSTANRAARPTGNILIGGMVYVEGNSGKNNGYWKDADGNLLSRTFPGVVDDVRIWNRTLTDDEIRYLAANPAVQNRAPQSEVPSVSSVETVRKAEATLPTVAAYDDGLPEGSELTGDWIVVGGDASAVAIDGDRLIATKKGVYKLVRRVSDGERSGFSEPVTVTVTSPGMVLLFK